MTNRGTKGRRFTSVFYFPVFVIIMISLVLFGGPSQSHSAAKKVSSGKSSRKALVSKNSQKGKHVVEKDRHKGKRSAVAAKPSPGKGRQAAVAAKPVSKKGRSSTVAAKPVSVKTKEAKTLSTTRVKPGTKPVPTLALGRGRMLTTSQMVVQAAEEETTPGIHSGAGSSGGSSEDPFRRQRGFVRPYLSISENYTDNLYNTKDNKEDDFVTMISPGIEISLPRNDTNTLSIRGGVRAPGGLLMSGQDSSTFRRYRLYLNARADFENYARHSDENAVSYRAEGLFQYNFRGGLQLEFIDQYTKAYDAAGSGVPIQELRQYDSNLFMFSPSFYLGDRFTVKVGYHNFIVDYKDREKNFQDRTDNLFGGNVLYKLSPKTSVFIEGQYIDVDYDVYDLRDNEEYNLFGGLRFAFTQKTTGSVKAGYGKKKYKKSDEEEGNFLFEGQLQHMISDKSSIVFNARRRTDEPDVLLAEYILSTSVGVQYSYRFTNKLRGMIGADYSNEKYVNFVTLTQLGASIEDREDDRFQGNLELNYDIRRWLAASAGYTFSWRDSNYDIYDYTSNTFFVKMTGVAELF